MPLPPKKPGDYRWSISFEKPPSSLAHEFVYAKDEKEAKKVFRQYVGKYEITNIVRR